MEHFNGFILEREYIGCNPTFKHRWEIEVIVFPIHSLFKIRYDLLFPSSFLTLNLRIYTIYFVKQEKGGNFFFFIYRTFTVETDKC